MTQHLIVPVDGSDSSWAAVDVAVSLARRIAAVVRVVEVVFDPADAADAEARLGAGIAEVDALDVDLELDVLTSDTSVAAAIESVLETSPGTTVVMSSHGRGRSAALVGSVAEDILLRTFGPIIIVGPHVEVGDFTGPIIATADGSDESEAALPLAASWGIELGVAPWIVHVAAEVIDGQIEGIDTVYTSRLARELSERTGHPVHFEELHDSHAWTAVPEFASRIDASLIVASSHGRSGLSRLTVGSVTAGFVRHATCPVMVVRLPHHTKRWDEEDARLWAM